VHEKLLLLQCFRRNFESIRRSTTFEVQLALILGLAYLPSYGVLLMGPLRISFFSELVVLSMLLLLFKNGLLPVSDSIQKRCCLRPSTPVEVYDLDLAFEHLPRGLGYI